MFEEERSGALELPAHPFDACIQHIRQADKYQTVLFEDVRYSVPRAVAFEPVTVKAYIEQVVLVHKGQVVATHRRSRTAGEQVLEPTHFLAAIERKPAYLDHTRLFKELKLPAAFTQLRQQLEKELGPRTGTRHYIRVLQLLGRYNVGQLARVIDANLHRQGLRAEFIEQKLNTASGNDALPACPEPARREPVERVEGACAEAARPEFVEGVEAVDATSPLIPTFHVSEVTPIKLPTVIVPPPDLRRFDQLLMYPSQPQGEENVRDVIEAQPQDAASADDAVGVCPALA
jgi:hypothetical protein